MIFETGAMRFGRFKNGKEKKGDPKNLFRQSKAWKDFREFMIGSQGNCCELCGMKYPGARDKMLQVHHLEPHDYFTLNMAAFSVLCSSCHDLIERFVTRINGKAFVMPKNYQKWGSLISAHLSTPARQKWEEMAEKNTQGK